MKKIFLISLLLCLIDQSNAAVLRVSNVVGSTAPYSQVDPALAVSFPGDTIYVEGSNTTYSTFTITKSIVIIGPGSLSNKQNAFPAKFTSITSNNNITGIIIKGLYLVGDMLFNNKSNLSQLEISGNYFNTNSSINFSGIANANFLNINNNLFSGGGIGVDFYNNSGMSNIIIQNNIFFGSIRSLNATNSLISHNVFINWNQAFEYTGSSFFTGVMIKDNIFYNSDPNANTSSCTYDNNLSFSTTATYTAMNGNSNLNNVNPGFVNVTTGTYTPSFNLHLTAVSPAKGASSTGDDIGYFGGSYSGYLSGEMGGLPVIRRMDVLNPNVPLNGNIDVKVISTKAH